MNPLVARMNGVGRNILQLRQAKLPWLVALGLLSIQAWVESRGGYRMVPWWYETLGLTRQSLLQGRLWQILSYALLHGSWLHVVANAGCLLMLGTRLEHFMGSGKLLKVLVLGTFGGAIGHLVLAPGGGSAGLLVGSSAACFCLLILITTLSPESRMWPLPVSGRSLGLGLLGSSAVLALVDPSLDLPGLSSVGRWSADQGLAAWWSIGHACHLGGGLAGWLYGRWMLRPRISLERLRRERARREAGSRPG